MINGNKIVDTFSANAEVLLYRHCAITDIFIGNQTANAITGLKIGTTNGGAEIYSVASPLAGFAFDKTNDPAPVFNFADDTPIYITATNWNGSSIGIAIKFEDLS